MPSLLHNTTLSHLTSGVSQQYESGKFDSQVSQMNNCIPNITRGVLRRNPLNFVKTLAGLPIDISNSFVYTYDRGTGDEQYLVVIPGNGYIYIYNVNTGDTEHISTVSNPYLITPVGSRAKHTFKAMTIGDHTFIVNTTITTSFTTDVAPSTGYSNMAFYWIKKTAGMVVAQEQTTTTVGSLIKGYTYTLNGSSVEGTIDTRPSSPAVNQNTSAQIASAIATATSLSVSDAVAYTTTFAGSDWVWSDSFGNEASLGVWKNVEASTKLPVDLPIALDGFKVKVTGKTSENLDDYFLEYDYSNRTWKEIPAPDSKIKLDPTTMPHVLYRLGTSGFLFDTYQGVLPTGLALDGISAWGNREAGGLDEMDDPSFVGKTITNLFFHKNRLGLLTSDSIVLSQTGAYGDFFIQTVQDTLDDDPIDLAIASTNVTILRHAVPTAAQLIIFADDTQFSLRSVQGPLTPTSADITPLSNYTYGNGADAKAIGNKVYFTNQAGGYSQVYSYQVSDQGSQVTAATSRTLHTPTYIDKSASKLIGHDVLGFVFIETEAYPKELTVLSSVSLGEQELQNAFHKWTFDEDILSTSIINNQLYILFTSGKLGYIALDIPGDITSISYLDSYDTDVYSSYSSEIELSELFYRGTTDKKGTERGRYQLRTLLYTINKNSKYITNIYSTDQSLLDPTTMLGVIWDDALLWDDAKIWVDIDPTYYREYVNDSKVTVMADSKRVRIIFKSSEVEPSKGFELSTINIEALFTQRSRLT